MNTKPRTSTSAFRGLATLRTVAGLRTGLLSLLAAGTIFSGQLRAADNVRLDLSTGWEANNGREFPGAVGDVETSADGKRLTIAYDFTNGGQYISAHQPLEEIGELAEIKLKAQGPGLLGVGLRDATGQHFVFHLGMTDSSEQTYAVNLAKPRQVYGGAKDKVIHYPLQGIRLLALKKPDVLKGSLVISEVLLVPAQ